MLAVILNGPIGSGKDTLADHLALSCGVNKLEFKSSLYIESYKWLKLRLEKFCSIFIPTYDRWVKLCTDRVEKESKVLPLGIPFLLDSNKRDAGHKMWSPRMVLQHVSENVVKPMRGDDAFGEMAAESLLLDSINVFSDGGFVDEINVISQKCPTLVVNLYRGGCSFEGDSRDYVTDSLAARTVKLTNNSSLESAFSALEHEIKSFVREFDTERQVEN